MANKRLQQTLERIAKQHLHLETLAERKSDHLDFHECSVWGIQAALEEAYRLGFAAGQKQQQRNAR